MGLIEAIVGQRVYLDTNIWIYGVEAYPDYIQPVTHLFEKIDQGKLLALTSELTLAEVLVKPLKDGDLPIVAVFGRGDRGLLG